MMIFKYRNNEEYTNLQEKLRSIRCLVEELEDFFCNTDEGTSNEERTSSRDDYNRSSYDNTSRSSRYSYSRR